MPGCGPSSTGRPAASPPRLQVTEPALRDEGGVPTVTCCLWRGAGDTAWSTGTITCPEEGDGDPDGASILFELLVDRSPEAYAAWASEYYETPVNVEAVRALLAQRALTPELVAVLRFEVSSPPRAAPTTCTGPPG
ncbi:hypothetical protein [Streptomyces sp. NBC_01643]|uniref:hypothetical protein n=1 Tax=Streptomyces sp. NBC_01643 TaxID=2975906 RepID=UPI003863AE75|nr:hypothetical protein OHB03_33525 [Streptomyces sp. NBC_01643]